MNKGKPNKFVGVFIFLLGFAPLMNSISNPRLATAHGSDYVQLIAVGWCFGIGACLLAVSFGLFEKQ